MQANNQDHRAILQSLAYQAMLDRGLLPDFSAAAMAELGQLPVISATAEGPMQDLRTLLWASIDNDDSRDLDQLTVAEAISGDDTKILVAIADVDAVVKTGSAIDAHAHHNTTSVYTAAEIFPMLPEKLSTDITSLNFNEDRLAMVVEMVVGPDGSLKDSQIYRARVRNQAKLAYNSVGAWLENRGDPPEALAAVPGLAENLRLQERAMQRLKNFRESQGALRLQTIEAKPVFDGGQLQALEVEEKNRAKEIIEDFMIAANGVVARSLVSSKFPTLCRVVRTPKRWDRIVEIAREHRFELPEVPKAKALEEFLVQAKAADPLRFPDLSLTIIKLLGSGEYLVELPERIGPGHFGLAVRDYVHSTAPNRRYPDLLTQRLLKAALQGKPVPYNPEELEALATHCTEAEDAARKVERQVGKAAAALLLEGRIGEEFEAIVTGAAPKGTWVRLLAIPVEGKLVRGFEGADVGQRLRVQLLSVDVPRGFIDLAKTA
jgi:VacB/RNase II family 3'-5' exoribonuclease